MRRSGVRVGNKAKLARLTARQTDERHNASDYDLSIGERADRQAQTYALLLSIAESLVELSRVVRHINDVWTTCDHQVPAS